jgi:hypothetical protein
MTTRKLRTTARAKAAIIGLGVASAVGTAAAIGVSTLQPDTSTDTWVPADTARQAPARATQGDDEEGGDDDGGWTQVRPPRSGQAPSQTQQQAPPAAQSSGS